MKPQTILLTVLYLIIFGLTGYFLYNRYFHDIVTTDNAQIAVIPDKTIFYSEGNNLYQLNSDVLNATSSDITNFRLQSTGQVDSIVLNKDSNLLFYEVTTPQNTSEIWQVNLVDSQSEKLISNQTPGLENFTQFRNPKISFDNQYLTFVATYNNYDYIFTYKIADHALVNLLYPNLQVQINDLDWSKTSLDIYFIANSNGQTSIKIVDLNKKIQTIWAGSNVISKISLIKNKIILLYQQTDVSNLGYFNIGSYEAINPITDLVSPKKVVRYDINSSGTQLVYQVTDTSSRSNDIYIVNSDGTNLLQLTNDKKSYYPIFSPDGQQVSFWVDGEGIYIISIDKKSKQKILNDQGTINNIILWS